MLDDVRVFDVYTGPQVGEGKRSLALALSFSGREQTLTDEDVAPARAKIVAALGELGASCVAELPPTRAAAGRPSAELRCRLAPRARRGRDGLRRRARCAPALAPPALRAGRRDRAL